MAESLVRRDGSLIIGPIGRSLLRTAGGIPQCCCGCDRYYLATLCNSFTCGSAYPYIYVCTTAVCPPGGGYEGPLFPGVIVKYNSTVYCYNVDTSKSYCKTPAPHCPGGPVRAPFVDAVDSCWETCDPPQCVPIDGYYRLWSCSCGNAGVSVPTNSYVHCSQYQAGLLSHPPCPVWVVPGIGCAYVPSNSTPVQTIPSGGAGWAGAVQFSSCCACCLDTSTIGGECCLCTERPTITLWQGNQSPTQCAVNTQQGPQPCVAYRAVGTSFQGCISRITSFNFGTECVSNFYCVEYSGLNRRERIWVFNQDCAGQPLTQVTCSCQTVMGRDPELVFDETTPLNPCQLASQTVPQWAIPSGGAGPPNCAIGQLFTDCRSYEVSWQEDQTSVGGVKNRIVGSVHRFSPTTGCTSESCGTGFGDTINVGGTEVTISGCANCGQGQKRTIL